jgi:uncharacterized C2H2 Zn-finger protein
MPTCSHCKREFQHVKEYLVHFSQVHEYPMLIDENLSRTHPRVKRLLNRGHKIIDFPIHWKGMDDEQIFSKLISRKWGLITCDKRVERLAREHHIRTILIQ